MQYLVFNEFEQRFSTSAPVDCFFERTLSSIDTRNPKRSIFSVFVAGTLSGQTRIRGVNGGLVALLRERYVRPTPFVTQFVSDPVFRYARNAAANVHMQGERTAADRIVLP